MVQHNALSTTLALVATISLINQVANSFAGEIRQSVIARRQFSLEILDLLPISGPPPRNGKECRMASEIVANYININRPDILPDYQLVIKAADESIDGQSSVGVAMQFLRGYESKMPPSNTSAKYPSPVVIAGFSTPGCSSLGKTLHHVGLVAFSASCAGPMFVDRSTYRNLYLNRAVTNTMSQGQLRFIRELGRWGKIAVLANLGNDASFLSATYLLKIAHIKNISVIWFDGVMDFKDISPIVSLKKSDARIVAFWNFQAPLTWHFLCIAYNVGMTGSRYVFILQSSQFSSRESIKINSTTMPGCTKEIVLEQYKYSIATGQNFVPFDKTVPSHLGYSANQFEVMYDSYSNNSRTIDYPYRFQCHDVALSAILTLHEAEKTLRKSYSDITLRNFTQFPDLIGKVVNASAIALDYNGLRTGKIKYSQESGELASDITTIAYWNGKELINIGAILQKDNTSGHDMDDYRIDMLLDTVPWPTVDGNPPRDAPMYVELQVSVPIGITAAVSVLAAAFFSILFLANVKAFREKSFAEKAIKFVGTAAMAVLYTAAVLFTVNQQRGSIISNLRIGLLTTGLAVVNSIIFGRIYQAKKVLPKFRRHAGTPNELNRSSYIPSSHLSTSFSSKNIEKMPTFNNRFSNSTVTSSVIAGPVEKQALVISGTMRFVAAFTLINVVAVVVWLSLDPLICDDEQSEPLYDVVLDISTRLHYRICKSSNHINWMYALASLHILLVLVGSLQAYHSLKAGAPKYVMEFKFMVLAVVNAAAILPCALLILLVMKNPIAQETAVAFLILTYSSITSCTWFAPYLLLSK